MAISSNLYLHDLDRSTLAALKAIPGFTAVLKGFMKIWSEKQFRIQNMATKLRINEKQLSKYYDMLSPICEKLGIEVPELYLELNGEPNAYTSGDTKPFIVMTTGLLEKFPEHLIPTVLAHECGHIACHHVLYHTMGNIIISGAAGMLEFGELITYPIQTAFYKWMRCSEYSADRAAAICDGTTDGVKAEANVLKAAMHEVIAEVSAAEDKTAAFYAVLQRLCSEGVDISAMLDQFGSLGYLL